MIQTLGILMLSIRISKIIDDAMTRSVPDPSRWTAEDLTELDRGHQILFGKPLTATCSSRD
jgi:hypothetical protein